MLKLCALTAAAVFWAGCANPDLVTPIDLSVWTNPVHDSMYMVTDKYTSALDPSTTYDGKPALLLASTDTAAANDCGYIYYDLGGGLWVGQWLRLRAEMKSNMQSDAFAGLDFLVYDFQGNTFSADDMSNRPLDTTTGWHDYADVLFINQGTLGIEIGAHLCGNGQLWIDDLRFDVVDNAHAGTATYVAVDGGTASDAAM